MAGSVSESRTYLLERLSNSRRVLQRARWVGVFSRWSDLPFGRRSRHSGGRPRGDRAIARKRKTAHRQAVNLRAHGLRGREQTPSRALVTYFGKRRRSPPTRRRGARRCDEKSGKGASAKGVSTTIWGISTTLAHIVARRFSFFGGRSIPPIRELEAISAIAIPQGRAPAIAAFTNPGIPAGALHDYYRCHRDVLGPDVLTSTTWGPRRPTRN